RRSTASCAVTLRARMTPWIGALAGLAIVTDLRTGAFALTLLGLGCGVVALLFFSASLRAQATAAIAALLLVFAVTSRPSAQQRITSALESTAKAHAGHVFTVGHAYKLLDEAYYFNPVTAAASTLTLTP